MKPRKYFNLRNLWGQSEPSETTGYPLSLPDLDGIEFATVRPLDGEGWHVIHVRTGMRVMYRYRSEESKSAAKESAMAEIERVAKKMGWAKMERDLRRRKTPCIVAALAKVKV